MNLSTRRWLVPREPTVSTRRSRKGSVAVTELEGRLLLAGDMTPPTTVAVVTPNTLNRFNYYTASPETVHLIASDPDSPIGLMTFYNVDNKGFVSGNTFQLFNGNHTVQFYSVDQSGNREATHVLTINIDSTTPVVTASANPTSLWPPNGKFVPVTVTGHVSDASGGVPGTVRYHVVDEYGKVQPSGSAKVGAHGEYRFVVMLQSSRLGQDKDGRQYTIIVTATDEAGNTGSARAFAVVPHDQGHHASSGNQRNGQGNDNSQGNENHNRHAAIVVVTPSKSKGKHGNGHQQKQGHGHGHG